MQESRTTEFKEAVSHTFLKTVSAYANYAGGVIYFGIDDNGNVKGLPDTKQACLDIENKINDSIKPQPDYKLEVQNNDRTIKLTVKSGTQKPYLYKAKAYKRNDTSTIEVDSLELTRLVLAGKNIRFEELPCADQELSFEILSQKLKDHIALKNFNQDTLRTLSLYNDSTGYNNAAGLLADKNHFPGIDLVKFGENISVINRRETFSNISILSVFDKVLEVYKDYYQYEVIKDVERKKIERIPEDAFREAVSNALIHRTWDVDACIKVSMFDDRIEILSPGGLPPGISESEYLDCNISILRNRNLANVFYRLGFVEIFGTGITRIKELYAEGLQQPEFAIFENSIKIVLPIFERDLNLENDELSVYRVLSPATLQSISDIAPNLPFSRSKTTKLLQNLSQIGVVEITGRGRGTKYRLNPFYARDKK